MADDMRYPAAVTANIVRALRSIVNDYVILRNEAGMVMTPEKRAATREVERAFSRLADEIEKAPDGKGE